MTKSQLPQAGSVAESWIQSKADATPPLAFDLLTVQRVDFGAKQGEATIEVVGLGKLDIDYFHPVGKKSFVAGRSIRQEYDGTFRRSIHLEREFANILLEAIESRLSAGEVGEAS